MRCLSLTLFFVLIFEGCDWHFFISVRNSNGMELSHNSVTCTKPDHQHCQSTGGDQAHSLCLDLEMKGKSQRFALMIRACQHFNLLCSGFKVWYDNRSDDLTTDGMTRGVVRSDIFVLFMSEGVMSRPFVHLVRDLMPQACNDWFSALSPPVGAARGHQVQTQACLAARTGHAV